MKLHNLSLATITVFLAGLSSGEENRHAASATASIRSCDDDDNSTVVSRPREAFSILDDESSGGECVWTGSSDGTSWERPGNWQCGRVPGPFDIAVFRTAANGATVTLSAATTICSLYLDGVSTFQITNAVGADNAVLAISGLSRVAADGDTPVHSLSVPIAVYPAGNGTNVWNVAGGGSLRITGGISRHGSDDFPIRKAGDGELVLAAANDFSGPWAFVGGVTTISAADALCGTTFVGGESEQVLINVIVNDAFAREAELWVFENGTYNGGGKHNGYSRLNAIRVYDGGSVTDIASSYTSSFYFRGGTISGVRFLSGGPVQNIDSDASPAMSRMAIGASFSQWLNLSSTIADGEAPVDLLISGEIAANDSNRVFKKDGAGTLKTTASWSRFHMAAILSEGTWLVDNSSGAGTGTKALYVRAGATLGGRGFIGGTANSANANVSVAGWSGNPATIAPGSTDNDTGVHLYGTLTVGSETQANSVTFGANSKLRIGLDTGGKFDSLHVHGTMDLSGTTDTLEIVLPDGCKEPWAGTYVIASATDGITGSFDTISLSLPNADIIQTEKQILLVYTPPTVILFRW